MGDTDDSNTMNKKVRNAQLAQYNFIFVVGEKERENGTVNIRTRDNKVHGEKSIDQVKELFKELSEKRILNSEEYSVQDVTDQLSIQRKYKAAEDRFEYGEMSI